MAPCVCHPVLDLNQPTILHPNQSLRWLIHRDIDVSLQMICEDMWHQHMKLLLELVRLDGDDLLRSFQTNKDLISQ